MRATEHLPEQLGSLAEMAASAIGVMSTDVPFCTSPCECADCETYYYTLEQQRIDRFHYTGILANEQAKVLLTNYISGIDSARKYLQKAIQQHGDVLLDRWRKRNPKKRAALLESAEPDLPARKGLAADISYSNFPWRNARSSSVYRKHYMLPYLDVETLSKNPATLLGLIHTRAKDAPADWAPYDHEQLRTPWGLGMLDVVFNKGAVIMFGPRYGTYTSWQKDSAHRFDVVGFPRARLVLETQATLLTFLQRVVEHLLSGVQLDDLAATGCTRWQANIDGGLKMTGDATAWSNFVQTPFSCPPRFDVDALVALVQARVTATGDHLALLQTEAPYFRRYMRKLYQMQAVESVGEKHIAITIVNWELVEDINLHWFWRCTMLEFENLQDLYHRYRDSITPGQSLPKKVDQALGAIELVLVNAIHERSKQLQAIISQRPGFRQNYVYGGTTMNAKGQYGVSHQIKKFAVDEQEGNAVIYREERLWWILMQLQGEPDSHTRFRYAMLLDMLDDHLANASSAERARLDEIMYEKFSDYATLLELLWSVRMHRPRNTNRSTADCHRTEDRIFWRTTKITKNAQLPDIIATVKVLKAFRATNAPAGPRNREWLEQFDRTHATLHEFWREMASSHVKTYKHNGFSEADIEFSMEPLQMWNHTDYHARLKLKRDQIEADIKKSRIVESEDIFLPLPSIPSSSTNPDRALQEAKPRTKPKTRGLPQDEDNKKVTTLSEHLATHVKTIRLSKSPYAALRYLFPTTKEERQKTIEWSVFVNSMNEAGFTARNGGGSIVRFENRNGEGSINFHRPHPESTIDPIMLQAIGWRMNKWFGWTRASFVLAKK